MCFALPNCYFHPGTRGLKTRKFSKLRGIIKLLYEKQKYSFDKHPKNSQLFVIVRLLVFNKSHISLKREVLVTQNGVKSTLAKPEQPSSKFLCKSSHILQTIQRRLCSKRLIYSQLKHVTFDLLTVLFGKNLVNADGSLWKLGLLF